MATDGDGGDPSLDLAEVLSRRGDKEVPHRFIQPVGKRPTTDFLLNLQEIPTIDWKRLTPARNHCDGDEIDDGEESIGEEVPKACEEWGFFQVCDYIHTFFIFFHAIHHHVIHKHTYMYTCKFTLVFTTFTYTPSPKTCYMQ